MKPLRLEEARVTVHEHPRRRHCIAGTGGAGGTGDVACAAGASSAYQERPVLALSGHTNRADECDFEGYDRHDADVTRCLLMTQSSRRFVLPRRMPRLNGVATAKPISFGLSRLIHPGAVPTKLCCGNSVDGSREIAACAAEKVSCVGKRAYERMGP